MKNFSRKNVRKYFINILPLIFSFSISQATPPDFAARKETILKLNCLKSMHLIDASIKSVTPEFLSRLSESEKDKLKKCVANNGDLKK